MKSFVSISITIMDNNIHISTSVVLKQITHAHIYFASHISRPPKNEY